MTSQHIAQKRDRASSGQDAPAEDIAKRLFVSEKNGGRPQTNLELTPKRPTGRRAVSARHRRDERSELSRDMGNGGGGWIRTNVR